MQRGSAPRGRGRGNGRGGGGGGRGGRGGGGFSSGGGGRGRGGNHHGGGGGPNKVRIQPGHAGSIRLWLTSSRPAATSLRCPTPGRRPRRLLYRIDAPRSLGAPLVSARHKAFLLPPGLASSTARREGRKRPIRWLASAPSRSPPFERQAPRHAESSRTMELFTSSVGCGRPRRRHKQSGLSHTCRRSADGSWENNDHCITPGIYFWESCVT